MKDQCSLEPGFIGRRALRDDDRLGAGPADERERLRVLVGHELGWDESQAHSLRGCPNALAPWTLPFLVFPAAEIGNAGNAGHDGSHELEALGLDLRPDGGRESRDVAAWSSQAFDQPLAYWIGAARHDDGDDRGNPLGYL